MQQVPTYNGNWEQLTSSALRSLIEKSVTIREQELRKNPTRETAAATNIYFRGRYEVAPLRVAQVQTHPMNNVAITYVIKVRIGALALTNYQADVGVNSASASVAQTDVET